jgi:hypothetical protein
VSVAWIHLSGEVRDSSEIILPRWEKIGKHAEAMSGALVERIDIAHNLVREFAKGRPATGVRGGVETNCHN